MSSRASPTAPMCRIQPRQRASGSVSRRVDLFVSNWPRATEPQRTFRARVSWGTANGDVAQDTIFADCRRHRECARRHPHRRNGPESQRSVVLRWLAVWRAAAGSVDQASRQTATSRGSDLAVKLLARGPCRDAAPCRSARPRSESVQGLVPSPANESPSAPMSVTRLRRLRMISHRELRRSTR